MFLRIGFFVLRQNKYINRFIDKGAVSRELSLNLNDLDLKKGFTFKRLMRNKVVKEQSNKYYLDKIELEKFKKSIKRFRPY